MGQGWGVAFWLRYYKVNNRLVFCIFMTGPVKKCGTLKIVHERFKSTRGSNQSVLTEFQQSFETAKQHNKDIEPLLPKAQVSY